MSAIRFSRLYKLVTVICWAVFLSAQTACSSRTSQTITGKVLDEHGNPLSGVTIQACYSGWGWGSGGLVWDRSYCSGQALTDELGVYVIDFEGPFPMRLLARKEGWVQLSNFNTEHSRIILTRIEEHIDRLKAQQNLRKSAFQQRRPGESDTAYYCRVVFPNVDSVTLEYLGEVISITQVLFEYGGSAGFLFSLRGSFNAVNSFAREAQFIFSGKPVSGNLLLLPDATSCKSDIYLVQAVIPNLDSVSDGRIKMLIPSVQAGWDMKIWKSSLTP